MSSTTLTKDKFEPFVVSTHTYKTVDNHPILLDVFIPKKLLNAGSNSEELGSRRPVMLLFHAGWLIGGQREYSAWWSQWILDLIITHNAIGITADHRLIPEATAEDVLDDIHDVWKWMGVNLDSTLQGIQADLSRVAVGGASAGGYCALQVALTYNNPTSESTASSEPKPRVVFALYPYVSIRTPNWTQAYTKPVAGSPQLPESLVDDLFASIADIRKKTGKPPVLSNAPMLTASGGFTDRALIAIAAEQHGRILDFFGPERDTSKGKRRMHPEDRIEDGLVLPPTVIIQGSDDSISPVSGADLFVEHIRKHKAVTGLAQGREEEVLRYYREPGEHFLEVELGLNGDTEDWIKEAAAFIEENWLAKNSAL